MVWGLSVRVPTLMTVETRGAMARLMLEGRTGLDMRAFDPARFAP